MRVFGLFGFTFLLAMMASHGEAKSWVSCYDPRDASSWDWIVRENDDGSYLVTAETDNPYQKFVHKSCQVAKIPSDAVSAKTPSDFLRGFMRVCEFEELSSSSICRDLSGLGGY